MFYICKRFINKKTNIMTNQEIAMIIEEVVSKHHKITMIEITDAYYPTGQRKKATIWIEGEEVCGECFANFELPDDINPHTINNYAYACLDVEDL